MRHGESIWNLQNKFTGWTDIKLSPKGIQQAHDAGRILKQNSFKFNLAFTSYLTRAIQTFNYAADQLNSHYIPVIKHWRLNQRHYGSLQGLNKAQTAQKFGQQQVKIWRRSYDVPPPPLNQNDQRCPHFDYRYNKIDKSVLPYTQSLKDTVARVIPYWNEILIPAIKQNNVLIVAHGNSIRAIVKYLDNISDKDIVELNIPTGIPLVYEFDGDFIPIRNYYIADQEELQEKLRAVKKQGQKKN